MPAHMVNAYYHPLLNEIAFPAGIMQPPFFDEQAEDAVNYGRIGMVIGHEFTHGFDDMGSKFAADGTFRNWWTEEDRELFEETGIDQTSIKLLPFIDFTWHTVNMEMKVFIGRINKEVKLIEEIHRLYWLSIDENFFDMTKFAGEGNIGHMIKLYQDWKES